MSEAELQAGQVNDEVIILDEPEQDAGDSSGELASPSEDQHLENGTDGQGLSVQEKHQKEVNRQHKKFRDEERARLQVEQEKAALQKQLDEINAKNNVAPEVPPMPDPYSENFESEVAARDEAIRNRAAWDKEQSLRQSQLQQEQQQQARKEQEQLQTRVESYSKRATDAGIKAEDLQAAGRMVGDYLQPDLIGHILDDEQGPMITTYLANNPTALDDIRSMSLGNAAVHIATVIKPDIAATKPKPSSAPDPVEPLRGAGAAPQEIGPQGATYE